MIENGTGILTILVAGSHRRPLNSSISVFVKLAVVFSMLEQMSYLNVHLYVTMLHEKHEAADLLYWEKKIIY